MTTHSWFRNLFARPVARPIRKRPHRARLALEILEDRTVPSTFTVTNTLDDGSAGSLRWAVGEANAQGGNQTINFDPTVFATPQTIALTGTQLELTDTTGTVTIRGRPGRVTVDGGGRSRVFQIDAGATASISRLTINGGFSTGNGGGLANLGGTLTLTDCTFTGNTSTINDSGTGGGGVYSAAGTTTLTNCIFSGNIAVRDGGGVFSTGGTTTVTNCTLSGNTAGIGGGGLFATGGDMVTLTDCTVSGNSAVNVGGGLENYQSTMTVTDCTVSGNSATLSSGGRGGGLFAQMGTTTLTDCTVSGNSSTNTGGGLYSTGGPTTLFGCTVSGNSAVFGGGLFCAGGAMTLTNSTVSANSATGNGSGLLNSGGTATLTNTIVAGNTGSSDLNGPFSGTHNLIGGDPLLAPLGDYGGPTQTMALLPGSPALNAGDPSQLGTADQRGVVRTGGVNIGAYQASATALLVSAPRRVDRGVPFDVIVTAVDPYGQIAVGYTGTVTFSTSDPSPRVVLPADYSFTLADAGVHAFTDTGLGETTLHRRGRQTLTVTDTADASITGQASIRVRRSRPGPSPAPGHGAVPAAALAGDLGWLPARSIHHGAGESSGWGWDWLDEG